MSLTFGLSGHSHDLCVLAPQLEQRFNDKAISSGRRVPFKRANWRSCSLRKSFSPSGTSKFYETGYTKKAEEETLIMHLTLALEDVG
uniref:Uncharacterized protein n=1 Tax=Romanomermis culicivorax TaxID=13658 RepID=A0A915KN62_ROMCU